MGSQRCLGIYVGFVFPLIIRYLEPRKGNVVKACPKDCELDEFLFPALDNGLLRPKTEQKYLGPHLRYHT